MCTSGRWHLLLLLLTNWAAVATAIAGPKRHRPSPLTRREVHLRPPDAAPQHGDVKAAALMEAAGSRSRGCPGGVICAERSNNLVWDQECWDCMPDYQQLYCEKASLTSPPTFVAACAKHFQYRGAYCKKFGEINPPEYFDDCFFSGSEYKEIYCEKLKLHGQYEPVCGADTDVGPTYCESFAIQMKGFTECHGWPGFMLLYCETKQNATVWDATCANHHTIGENYCEDFAIDTKDIRPDCQQYVSYMQLFCDTKATENVSSAACAANNHVAAMYCEQMALKKNGVSGCWGIAQFDSNYCDQITWTRPECEALAGTSLDGTQGIPQT